MQELPVKSIHLMMEEVDPARCKPWAYHNRDIAWLTKERCQDLIYSIKKNGQNDPILVRRIVGDPNYDYEIIYGVRRWFACSMIPNQKVLVKFTDADDKHCMVLMHIENADSKDISEFERAFSFAEQMKSGLFKNQTELADAVGLTQGTISKMIKAANIFEYEWIRQLFPNKLEIPVKPAYIISKLLRKPKILEVIKKEALNIRKKQENLNSFLSASEVIKRLIHVSRSERTVPTKGVILSTDEKPLISFYQDIIGKFHIKIEKYARDISPKELELAYIKAIRAFSDKLFPGK